MSPVSCRPAFRCWLARCALISLCWPARLGMSVATGLPFLQRFPTPPGRVLYLALAESVVQVRSRATSLLDEQVYPNNFHLAFQWSPFRQHGLADLEDVIVELDGLRLVIVDPLEFVLPLRTEPASGYRIRQAVDAALTFFLPLRELAARYNLAILLLHHLPDDWPTNRRDPLAGTGRTGLTSASACNLVLTSTGDPYTGTLHLAGANVPERRLRLALDNSGRQWVCGEQESQVS